jgi:hypothetical protein
MECMDQMLKVLLQGAVSEHGSEAPALTDVTIERGRGCYQPRLWVEFSNGYRISTSLSAGACYAFCERHAAWDVKTFHHSLLREARRIYVRMLKQERGAWFRELMQRLANTIERRMRLRRVNWAIYGGDAPLYFSAGSPEAQDRGLRLLTENLTPAQRGQYENGQYFDVSGGTSGNRYRIRHGRSMNIDQLDKWGQRVCGWCFVPQGRLVTGDVMLAQKVALELFEPEALHVAHKILPLSTDQRASAQPFRNLRDHYGS